MTRSRRITLENSCAAAVRNPALGCQPAHRRAHPGLARLGGLGNPSEQDANGSSLPPRHDQTGQRSAAQRWDVGGEIGRQGVGAIPTFHPGEPWSVLDHLVKTYPKIALGGVVRWNGARKRRWFAQVFARAWPKRIHGLGIGDRKMLMEFPFHSVDCSRWE